MFSFDLHAAYHHFEMSYPHTKFVGFFQDFRRCGVKLDESMIPDLTVNHINKPPLKVSLFY